MESFGTVQDEKPEVHQRRPMIGKASLYCLKKGWRTAWAAASIPFERLSYCVFHRCGAVRRFVYFQKYGKLIHSLHTDW